jgi:hypothetical protein
VTPFRFALPVFARIAALAVLATQVVLAGASLHLMCPAAKHDCGPASRVAACCCEDDTEAARAVGPIAPAVRVPPPTAETVGSLPHRLAPPTAPSLPAEGAPETAVPADLTILLTNLRV